MLLRRRRFGAIFHDLILYKVLLDWLSDIQVALRVKHYKNSRTNKSMFASFLRGKAEVWTQGGNQKPCHFPHKQERVGYNR